VQILVVVAATQAKQLCKSEWITLLETERICSYASCRNEFFSKNSDGIIALRAEVEKVSGRAALDSG